MKEKIKNRECLFTEELEQKYGQLISSGNIVRELGFSSCAAFRQALYRKKIGFNVFKIENRRGNFAFTKDVALWLAKQGKN